MQRFLAVMLVVGVAVCAALMQQASWAQFSGAGSTDMSQFYTKSQVDSAVAAAVAASQSTVMAAMPLAGDIVPPTDTLTGAIGVSPRYMRQDAPRPTISQRTTTTTDASGNFSVGWAKDFNSSVPTITPTPLSPTVPKAYCKVNTRDKNTVTGYCWQENIQLATATVLGVSVVIGTGTTISSNYVSGQVMVVGIEPSQ